MRSLARNTFASLLPLAILLVAATPLFAAEGDKVYTVEGDIQEPVKVHTPPPVYPPAPKEERIQGTVLVRSVITTQGNVESIEVIESPGEEFAAAVRESLRQWEFEPAKLDGEPVKVHYHLTFNFKLDSGDDEAPATADRGRG